MSPKIFHAIGVLSLCIAIFLAIKVYSLNSRIAYVDSARLLNEYKGMIEAKEAFRLKATAWQANIDTLSKEAQQQIASFQKESVRMTKRERELSQELISAKQKELLQYKQALNLQAQDEDQKMTSAVVAEVNVFLSEFGKSRGYTIIMAATNGNIAFADEQIDVTNEVLAGMNSQYKK